MTFTGNMLEIKYGVSLRHTIFLFIISQPAFYCRYNKLQHYPLQLKRKGVNLQV